VAGSAVCDGLAAGAQVKTMETAGETGDAIGGEIVTRVEALVAVAAAAGGAGEARWIYERPRIAGCKDVVFAVTVGADGGIGDAVGDGLAVNAFVVYFFDLRVARAAGGGDIPMIDFRARVTSGINGMAGVTIRAGRRGLISGGDGAAMDAQLVGFHRVGEGNLVFRQKICVRMAGTACLRKIFFGDSRFKIVRRQHFMGRPVACLAGGSLRIAILCRRGVNAGEKFLDLISVASGADFRCDA